MTTSHLQAVAAAVAVTSIALVMGFGNAFLLNIVERGLNYYFPHPRYAEGMPFDTDRVAREYDFVIAGGGTAGCVLANRLSEIPGWQILLLESGGDELFIGEVPLLVAYLQQSPLNWAFRSERQSGFCEANDGKRCHWPRGKVLGGSSSINYMIYTRGNTRDYDSWEEQGNEGWGYRHILKYFKKSENANIPGVSGAGDGKQSSYHATGGFLDVQHVPYRLPIAHALVAAASELGLPYNLDYNGEYREGVSYIQSTMRNGSRMSSSKAFLRPVRTRSNLHVVKNAHVTRIKIDPVTKRAIGVEFRRRGKRYIVDAKKEVVLSAGAINSPQILMLSGIGPEKHLADKGIKAIVDLPGVGENLQDHLTFSGLIFLLDSPITLVEKRAINLKNSVDYSERRTGPFTIPGGVEVIAYTNSGTANATNPSNPDVELLMISGSLAMDDGHTVRKGIGISDSFYDEYFRPINSRDACSVFALVLNPDSKGSIKLRNSDPMAWPIMNANYFSDTRDLERLATALKNAMKLADTKSLKRYGAKIYDRPIPGCGNHEFGSVDYWKCGVRKLTTPLHHQCGTAKMGPSTDKMAVVDEALRVRGIKNLRVVDASIIPTIPSAHLYAPVLMIAEKAADMIKTTWRSL